MFFIINSRVSSLAALIPAVAGVHLNNYDGNALIDRASSKGGYIDFTTVGTDMKGPYVV